MRKTNKPKKLKFSNETLLVLKEGERNLVVGGQTAMCTLAGNSNCGVICVTGMNC